MLKNSLQMKIAGILAGTGLKTQTNLGQTARLYQIN